MFKLSDVVYETPSKRFWILQRRKGHDGAHFTGYQVMRVDCTHSVCVATIGEGPAPRLGVERAKAVANELDAAQ